MSAAALAVSGAAQADHTASLAVYRPYRRLNRVAGSVDGGCVSPLLDRTLCLGRGSDIECR